MNRLINFVKMSINLYHGHVFKNLINIQQSTNNQSKRESTEREFKISQQELNSDRRELEISRRELEISRRELEIDERDLLMRSRERRNTEREFVNDIVVDYGHGLAIESLDSSRTFPIIHENISTTQELHAIANQAVTFANTLFELDEINPAPFINFSMVRLVNGRQQVHIVQYVPENIHPAGERLQFEIGSITYRPRAFNVGFPVPNEVNVDLPLLPVNEVDQERDEDDVYQDDFEDEEPERAPLINYVEIYLDENIISIYNTAHFYCSICMNDLEYKDIVVLNECRHMLCLDCANPFFNCSRNCMLCRSRFAA